MSPLAQRFLYGIPILGGVVGLLAWDLAGDEFHGVTILAVLFGLGGLLEISRLASLGLPLTLLATTLPLYFSQKSLKGGKIISNI